MPDSQPPSTPAFGRGIGKWLRGGAAIDSAGETPQIAPVATDADDAAPPTDPASFDLTPIGAGAQDGAPNGAGAFQVTHLRVDPARVRIWPGNARVYALLNMANCRDLIDSIIAEGGQKMPAIVRRVADDPDHDFEVITGTRRHFAVSWLRASGRDDLYFIVQVEALDDEAAFRLADLENRARNDVSDFERARNYAAALASHYDGHLTRMAERLNLSKGWLSKMIRIASLPEEVIAVFADPRDLRLRSAYALSKAMESDEATASVLAMAAQITRAQAARLADGHAPHGPVEIQRALMDAAGNKTAPLDFVHEGPGGAPALSLVSASKSGVTLKLHSGSGASRDDLVAGLGALLDKLAAGGHSLG